MNSEDEGWGWKMALLRSCNDTACPRRMDLWQVDSRCRDYERLDFRICETSTATSLQCWSFFGKLWNSLSVVDGDVSWLHTLNRQFTSTGSKILDQLDKLNCSVFSTTTTSLKRVEQCTMCTRCITRSAQNGPRMQPSQVPHLQVYKVHHYTGQVISN